MSWDWDVVRQAYERAESEIAIRRYARDSWQPIQQRFYDGFVELGYREVADLNDVDAWHGVIGPAPINRSNTVRQGTHVTYLRRARSRPNLEIRDRALVDRVLLSRSRVGGVRYVDGAGALRQAYASCVVLSAGTYGTPAILIRSGIGPAEHVRELGIAPVADLPVGSSLNDHVVCGFELATEVADIRAPSAAVLARDPENGWFAVASTVDEGTGVCAIAFVLADDSPAGTVRLSTTDPTAPPLIDHRYDLSGFGSARETLGQLLQTRSLRDVDPLFEEGGLGALVDANANSAYHPVGSCPMGTVVSDKLAVFSVENLFVADASVFPSQVSNNPNLTCYMVGERAAALVAEHIGGASETQVLKGERS